MTIHYCTEQKSLQKLAWKSPAEFHLNYQHTKCLYQIINCIKKLTHNHLRHIMLITCHRVPYYHLYSHIKFKVAYRSFKSEVSSYEGERSTDTEPQSEYSNQSTKRHSSATSLSPQYQIQQEKQSKHQTAKYRKKHAWIFRSQKTIKITSKKSILHLEVSLCQNQLSGFCNKNKNISNFLQHSEQHYKHVDICHLNRLAQNTVAW